MTDPEIEYARLVSGDAAAVRARAEDLLAGTRDLLGVRTDLADAQDVPVWSGAAATAFVGRAAGLRHGLSLTRVALERARGALEAARRRTTPRSTTPRWEPSSRCSSPARPTTPAPTTSSGATSGGSPLRSERTR